MLICGIKSSFKTRNLKVRFSFGEIVVLNAKKYTLFKPYNVNLDQHLLVGHSFSTRHIW